MLPTDVIHTVGPIAQGDPSPSQVQELRNCYLNSLQLALENRLRSVVRVPGPGCVFGGWGQESQLTAVFVSQAFPCISTGVFGECGRGQRKGGRAGGGGDMMLQLLLDSRRLPQ